MLELLGALQVLRIRGMLQLLSLQMWLLLLE